MSYCTRCGVEAADEDMHCASCGGRLREPGQTPPPAGTPAPSLGDTRLEPTNEDQAGDLAAGSFLDRGRYRIEELLGAGGMGSVYRATDLKLNETVALKTIHPHLLAGTTGIERLRKPKRSV